MKKKVSIILAMILIFCITCTAQAEEILFRGIPWFSDYATVMEAFSELSVVWKTPTNELGKYVEHEIEGKSSSYDRNYHCVCNVASESRETSIKVAGYDVSNIMLYFAYTPNEKNEIDHKLDNTSFYMARYIIYPSDTSLALNDLKDKLSKLYGAVIKTENENECSDNITVYRWNGSKDTFVVLYQADSRLYIYYATAEGTNLIKTAEAVQKSMEAEELKNAGSDGL